MSSETSWNPDLWLLAGGDIPDDWTLVPFGQLLESPKSIAVGVMYPGEQVDNGIPMIRVGDVQDGIVQGQPSMSITDEVHREYRRTALLGNELLITLVGSPGTCIVCEPKMKGWNVARALAVARLKNPALRSYVKAVFESAPMRSIILSMLNTTVQPTLNLKEIKMLPVPLPRNEESAIYLGLVSDLFLERIANLRATNATLEAIAQAIFKSWFIDFDPVRAKMEGREPEGMDAETAALFPSEFEESELGLIPRGWPVSTVGDVAAIVKGRSYKSSELADSTTALVTLKSFERGGGFRLDGFKGYTGTYKPEQVVNAGECIIAFTDVTQQAEVIGRGALVLPSPLHSLLVASLDVGIIRPLSSSVSTLFLHHLLQGDRYVSHIGGFTSGTTVLHLAKLGVPSYRFAIPNSELIASFTDLVKPLWNGRVSNESTRYKLADLRDQLLPRLISGKLRIDVAQEAVVESA
jgi:type I restriction enzyme, S subunit